MSSKYLSAFFDSFNKSSLFLYLLNQFDPSFPILVSKDQQGRRWIAIKAAR